MSNKAKRLKVLHIIPSIADCRGGPSKAVVEMVEALIKVGIDAEIATTNDNGQDELTVELNSKITYRNVPVRFFKRYSPRISAIREFAYSPSFKLWLVKHIHDYDLIHVHAIFSYCSSFAMRTARKSQVPYIVRPIGQLEGWSLAQSKVKKAVYLKVIEKKNIQSAQAVHFTAQSEKDQATERFSDINSAVIPLGIHLPPQLADTNSELLKQWQLQPEKTPYIITMSRLHPKKGLELLLQAFAISKVKNVNLVIAGTGEPAYLETLKALCTQLGIAHRCLFTGFVKGVEKNALLQGATLFCLSSYSENFGIAVLEAMANGTAPLVSKEVALASDVSAHALGFVCKLNESDISEKIDLALSDLNSTRERGSKARDHVEQNYQWSDMAEKIKTLYLQR